jgi:hypothetical protein
VQCFIINRTTTDLACPTIEAINGDRAMRKAPVIELSSAERGAVDAAGAIQDEQCPAGAARRSCWVRRMDWTTRRLPRKWEPGVQVGVGALDMRSGLAIEQDLPRGGRPVKVDAARIVRLTTQTLPAAATAGVRARWRRR